MKILTSVESMQLYRLQQQTPHLIAQSIWPPNIWDL